MGRFTSVDPLAGKYPAWTPYHYVHNNPVRLVDVDGMEALPFRNLKLGHEWDSKVFKVHQKANNAAIWRVKDFSAKNIARNQERLYQLNRATEYADSEQFQTGEYSYRHGMRNENQTIPEAMELADKFVRKQFKTAMTLKKLGKEKEAYFELGLGLHALQDATSPAHNGFQEWSGNESFREGAAHSIKEFNYPGEESNLQKITNWFIDTFENNKKLPKTNLFKNIESD